jgi:hypothetical protein
MFILVALNVNIQNTGRFLSVNVPQGRRMVREAISHTSELKLLSIWLGANITLLHYCEAWRGASSKSSNILIVRKIARGRVLWWLARHSSPLSPIVHPLMTYARGKWVYISHEAFLCSSISNMNSFAGQKLCNTPNKRQQLQYIACSPVGIWTRATKSQYIRGLSRRITFQLGTWTNLRFQCPRTSQCLPWTSDASAPVRTK